MVGGTSEPARQFPPLSGPSRRFVFDHELSYPVYDSTRRSEFVLYDNGAFVLRGAVGQYRGGYSETDGALTFDWQGWSVAGPWSATGTVAGDSLTIRYNVIMEMTDFQSAVYVLAR